MTLAVRHVMLLRVERPVVRVLIVDDHAVFAASLATTLDAEPDFEVVAAVTSAGEALDIAGDGVDVVLSDFRMGGGTGVDLAREIIAQNPEVRVVMLTASHDESVLAAALDAGCTGFVTKSEPLESVIQACHAARAGEAVITPSLLARLLPRMSSSGRKGRNPDLTPREREVLALVVRGLTNQDIADELVLARDTVRNHVASILAKLGAHSKLQAAAIATRRGLVSVPEQ